MKKEISLDHLFKKLVMCSGLIAGAILVISAILLIGDVICRSFLNSSLAGATELIIMFMVWIAYFSISYTLMERGHIQMTSFTDKFNGKAKYINEAVVHLLCLIFFIFMAKIGFDVFSSSLSRGELIQSTIKMYGWIGKLPIFVGSAIMALQAGAMFAASVINLKNCDKFEKSSTEKSGKEEA